jgi:hypothetical protein
MKRPVARVVAASIALAVALPALAKAPPDQYDTFGPFDPTIADLHTRLTWQRGYAPAASWDAARSYCAGLALGGQSGWRIPTVKELLTLVDEQLTPRFVDDAGIETFAIDLEAFPSTPSARFWSWPKLGADGFYVDFGTGAAATMNVSTPANVRCVHGP